jgi:hypothetical protein
MGRKKIYKTEEEKQQANKEKYMRYYWKNCDKIKKKNLKRYYENKRNIQDNQ